jgi:type I restriction enzyme S subunit
MEAVNVEHKKELKKVPKLRFPEFEGEWSIIKLGDEVTKIGSGVTPRGGSEVYTDTGVLFIRSQNVNHDRLILEDVTYIPEDIHVQMKSSEVHPSDILLNITGASIGRSCIVPDDFFIGNVNQHVCIIRLKNGHVSKFYQAFLSSHKGQKLVYQGQAGGGREGLNFQSIRSFKLGIPRWPEQKKIAVFLSTVDQKIQQLTRKKELLEQYKKGMMQKIFSQEIRFKPALSEVEGEENGNDYPDWEEKQLSEFLIPTFREIPTPSKLYLAIGVRSHCRGTFQKPDSDPNAIAMDKLFVVKENDLIVNITFAWEGAIAMVKKRDDGGLVSHRFPTYTFDRSKVLSEFFKYVFVQKRFRYTLDLISPGGAGRNRVLSKKEFLKIKWTMPLIEEQKKIASFLETIDKKIEKVTNQLTQTQQFKKGLLQQMFV